VAGLPALAEVEARGVHRTRACSSLYTYCIYELRFSEDAAARRAGAAKLVKRFPALLDAIAGGELHLTGSLMLGPHLTLENHLQVLARAKFRTKKEIAKLVRILAPLPEVPDRIQPLRPETSQSPRNPTWQEFAAPLGRSVRKLAPGQRPRDWANDTLAQEDRDQDRESLGAGIELRSALSLDAECLTHAPARDDAPAHADASQPPEDRPSELARLDGPQLYQMQLTTSEEHVQLVERARALLSHQSPAISLGALHLQAMRMLVAALEKQRFAVAAPQRQRPCPPDAAPTKTEPAQPGEQLAGRSELGHTRQRGTNSRAIGGAGRQSQRSQPSRYIPAAVRRAIFERDGARCTYVDERGQRCRETHGLEIHHLKPFGKGGEHEVSNLTLLRCEPHNTLAAEQAAGAALRSQRAQRGVVTSGSFSRE